MDNLQNLLIILLIKIIDNTLYLVRIYLQNLINVFHKNFKSS